MVDQEVRGALAPVVKRLEATFGTAEMREVASDGFDALYWAFRHLQGREAWAVDGAMIDRYRPPLGPGVAERFAFARKVTDAQVADARAVRERFGDRFRTLLGADGILILPAMPDVPPLLSESGDRSTSTATRP